MLVVLFLFLRIMEDDEELWLCRAPVGAAGSRFSKSGHVSMDSKGQMSSHTKEASFSIITIKHNSGPANGPADMHRMSLAASEVTFLVQIS